MRQFVRPFALSGLLVAGSVLPHVAAAPPPSLFPPASTFVLSADRVGGPTTVTTLSPADLHGPARPLTRTEYDLPHLNQSYRVNVFRSSSDATTSLQWQMVHLSSPYRFMQDDSPGMRLYYSPGPTGATISASVYRNIEFVMVVGGGNPPATEERVVIGSNNALRALAEDFASHTRSRASSQAVAPSQQRRHDAAAWANTVWTLGSDGAVSSCWQDFITLRNDLHDIASGYGAPNASHDADAAANACDAAKASLDNVIIPSSIAHDGDVRRVMQDAKSFATHAESYALAVTDVIDTTAGQNEVQGAIHDANVAHGAIQQVIELIVKIKSRYGA